MAKIFKRVGKILRRLIRRKSKREQKKPKPHLEEEAPMRIREEEEVQLSVSSSPSSDSSTPSLPPTTTSPSPSFEEMRPVRGVTGEYRDGDAVRLTAMCAGETKTTVTGRITVRNIAYEKKVTVRSSIDGWTTEFDTDAVWLCSEDNTDIFVFELPWDSQRGMELAVRYTCGTEMQWDNNGGKNYVV